MCYDGFSDEYENECVTDANFTDLDKGEWKVSFSYGTVYGTSLCRVPNSNESVSTDGCGEACFCRVTGVKPLNGTLQNASGAWVQPSYWSDMCNCMDNCAESCAQDLFGNYNTSTFRPALYGQSQ